ncbi:Protein spitz [Trichinella sp. T9]|nr:Protein spitz [Trichinella sp. T9]
MYQMSSMQVRECVPISQFIICHSTTFVFQIYSYQSEIDLDYNRVRLRLSRFVIFCLFVCLFVFIGFSSFLCVFSPSSLWYGSMTIVPNLLTVRFVGPVSVLGPLLASRLGHLQRAKSEQVPDDQGISSCQSALCSLHVYSESYCWCLCFGACLRRRYRPARCRSTSNNDHYSFHLLAHFLLLSLAIVAHLYRSLAVYILGAERRSLWFFQSPPLFLILVLYFGWSWQRLLTFLFAICCTGNADVGFASENSFWYDVAIRCNYFLIFTGAVAVESCSTRPSPKHWVVRPPLSTYLLRENCTEDYAALYCLNDGICFRTKVTDTFIFSCECQPGWYGQRCEYQDTGDRYLPVQQRVEVAGIAGSVTVLIIIVIFVSVVLYIYYRRRRISDTMQTSPVISYCHACDMPIRQLCSGIASSKPRSHVKNALRTSVDVGDSANANQCDNREDAAAQTLMSASTSQNKISGSGIVCRVEESFAFISSKRYGSIYVPGSVMIVEGDDSHGDSAISSKLRVDDVVHFKAINQFGPKDCQWMAVSLKKSAKQALANSSLPSIISNQIGLIVDIHDRTMFIYNETYGEIYYPLGAHLAYLQELKMGSEEVVYASFMETFYNNQTVLFNAVRQTEVNDCAYVATAVWPANEQITGEMNVMSEIGNIVKLSSHYGYILSESLGQVFFSISNCENYTSPELTLFDLFEVNDLVHFNPMKQPEMNGCNWRALNVMKFQFAAEENPLWDNVVQNYQFENDQFSISNSNATVRVDVENSKPPKTTVDKACQTVTPPEMFLLKAVTADPTFYMELHRNFPHLMKFIDKACFQYFLCWY